jgi:nicotinamidase-related amidase
VAPWSAVTSATASAQQTIIDQWASVQAPAAPTLKEVTVDPATTALLLLDFVKQTCNEQVRPRCVANLPNVKQLLAEARAKNMLVVYSIIGGATPGDIRPELAPTGNEPVVQAGPDKFLNSDLEKILKDRGVKTVIVTGTAAHGVVLHTGDEAVFRGFKVIVPVDAIAAENTYVEQYVVYNFANGPVVAGATTLTRVSMIKF